MAAPLVSLRDVSLTVAAPDGSFRPVFDRLSLDMKAEFSDVRSMIKFSHSELDRRITTLEEGFSDLKSRVDRLESSAQ